MCFFVYNCVFLFVTLGFLCFFVTYSRQYCIINNVRFKGLPSNTLEADIIVDTVLRLVPYFLNKPLRSCEF